jgi:AbrB family looped-hinge helix DNA binding protein
MSTEVLRKINLHTNFRVKSSSKGQIVIPKQIRNILNIQKGTSLIFRVENKKIILDTEIDDLESIFGTLGKKLKPNLVHKKTITQKQFEIDLAQGKDTHFKKVKAS